MSERKACDLCGLNVGAKPFVLNGPEHRYEFCCEGCRGIFEMLHDIKETPVHNADDEKKAI